MRYTGVFEDAELVSFPFAGLWPDMEEVYCSGFTSDEDHDEESIFVTRQNRTLKAGEDSPKAGGLANENKIVLSTKGTHFVITCG